MEGARGSPRGAGEALSLEDLLVGLDPASLSLAALCERCAVLGGSAAVGLALRTDGHPGVVVGSNAVARQLEDLQLLTSGGPSIEALTRAEGVLVPDLAAITRWEEFAPAAEQIGIHSVFSFPLRVDGHVGALTFYRSEKGEPSGELLSTFRRLTLLVMAVVLSLPVEDRDGLAQPVRQAAGARDLINQAAGIASVRLDCTIDEALAALRARALASGTSLEEVARSVIAGTTRLT